MSVINTKELARAIFKVWPCVSKKNEIRSILKCILFEVKDGLLTLVGSDGWRIATVSLKADLPDGKWLLHHKDAQALRRDLISLKAVWQSILFTREIESRVEKRNLILIIPLDGVEKTYTFSSGEDYPRWRHLMPSSFTTEITFLAKEMKEALKTVRIKDEWIVRLYIEKGETPEAGEIKLLVKSEEFGDKEAIVRAKVKGEPIKQAFNLNYLRQAANSLGGEIIFRTSGGHHPALFKRGEIRWLILPTFVSW